MTGTLGEKTRVAWLIIVAVGAAAWAVLSGTWQDYPEARVWIIAGVGVAAVLYGLNEMRWKRDLAQRQRLAEEREQPQQRKQRP